MGEGSNRPPRLYPALTTQIHGFRKSDMIMSSYVIYKRRHLCVEEWDKPQGVE